MTHEMIAFTVHGTPIPQGSMHAFTPKGWKRPILTSDNRKTKPWRQEIAGSAQAAMRDVEMGTILRTSAVRVECQFYFARPLSLAKRVTQKMTKPDLDKLARALLDALTGICFEDDSQVTQLWVNKHFDRQPRAEIRVTRLSE